MRHIIAQLLAFSGVALVAMTGCVPRTPDLEGLTAGSGGAAGGVPGGGGTAGAPQADAALPSSGDLMSDRPRDAALPFDGRPDVAPKEVGADGAREVAGDGTGEVVPDVRLGRPPRAGELAITELLVDPAGNDLGHEWVEIANLTDDAPDLSTLRLADDATEFPFDAGVLEPRALLVLGQSADRAHNGDAPVERAYGTRLAFNNGADSLRLCAGPCAGGVVLASFTWTSSYAGRAMIVTATGTTCPATEPYGTGPDLGTPGHPNPPCASQPDAGPDGADR
jgi:hypothetical protein